MISRYKFLHWLGKYNGIATGVLIKNLLSSSIKKNVPCSFINFSNYENSFFTILQKQSFNNWQILNSSRRYHLNYYQHSLSDRKYSALSYPHPVSLIHYREFVSSSKTFKELGTRQSDTHFGVSSFVKKEILFESKGIIYDLAETKEKVKGKVGKIVERENIWTIPNYLCVGRIIATPFLCYSVIASSYTLALGIFIAAGISDLVDGMIARTFPSQASRLGSFLDPLADKILISSLFLTLTYVGLIPFLLTGIIVYRDIIIIAGASYVRYRSLPPPHTISRYFDATHATAQLTPTLMSKMNTAIQLTLITTSLAAPVFAYTDHYLLQTLWFVTGLTTLASGIGYIFSKESFKILSEKKT